MKKLSYFLSLGIAACLLVSCGGNSKKESPKDEGEKILNISFPNPVGKMVEIEVPASETCPAYVIEERPQVDFSEIPAGVWVSLFDGKTFNGWRGYNRDDVPKRWTIDNGAIKFNGSGGGEAQESDGGDIIFACKFKNFEIAFDWKASKGANSGVFVLAQEIKNQPIYISSPEYQILDNENHPDALEGENGNRKSASLYDMLPAEPQNAKPFDEWNTGSIKVYKGSVFHKQNDKTVVEYHLWTPRWTEMLQDSKFSQTKWPLAFELLNNLGGPNREGYFGFQDHGDDVWFKNIRIKILD